MRVSCTLHGITSSRGLRGWIFRRFTGGAFRSDALPTSRSSPLSESVIRYNVISGLSAAAALLALCAANCFFFPFVCPFAFDPFSAFDRSFDAPPCLTLSTRSLGFLTAPPLFDAPPWLTLSLLQFFSFSGRAPVVRHPAALSSVPRLPRCIPVSKCGPLSSFHVRPTQFHRNRLPRVVRKRSANVPRATSFCLFPSRT